VLLQTIGWADAWVATYVRYVQHGRLRPPALIFVVCIFLSAFGALMLSPRPAEAEGLDDLQARLQEAIDASGYDITIAITDLQTGETAAVRGDEPRLSGCTINLLVLIQATLEMQAGSLQKQDVDSLLSQTIRASDPHTSRQLVTMIGGGDVGTGIMRVRQLASDLGLTTAAFDHPPAYDTDSPSLTEEIPLVAAHDPDWEAATYEATQATNQGTAGVYVPQEVIAQLDVNQELAALWNEWIPAPEPAAVTGSSASAARPEELVAGVDGVVVPDNVISPLDMNKALAALWHQQVLNPEWTAYLLDRMQGVSPGLQYILGYARGSGAVVSHKNGYYWTPQGWTDNDVGIVSFSAGGNTYAYAVSYYAANLGSELGDVGIAQKLMRIVWDHFQQQY
jgi:beta-lactamase family protein